MFPWVASGRSLSIGRSEGMTKGLFDANTGRILGMGICGTNAGELIAEATLAIEMGADMSDISLTIHRNLKQEKNRGKWSGKNMKILS